MSVNVFETRGDNYFLDSTRSDTSHEDVRYTLVTIVLLQQTLYRRTVIAYANAMIDDSFRLLALAPELNCNFANFVIREMKKR